MAVENIKVPDLGGAEEVEVIEIAVSPGDEVGEEDTLIVLESDKATMDVPSPVAGVVKKILVKLGDTVSEGTPIVDVELEGEGDEAPPADKGADNEPASEETDDGGSDENAAVEEKAPQAANSVPDEKSEQNVDLPDLGTDDEVEVIEVAVAAGDVVEEGQTLMTLEGDKATMDVPSPQAGKLVKVLVSEGDKVKSGQQVAIMEVVSAASRQEEEEPEKTDASTEDKSPATSTPSAAAPQGEQTAPQESRSSGALDEPEAPASEVYAGPLVRRYARELGVDLRNVKGSGVKGRVQKEDVQAYVKQALSGGQPAATAAAGSGIPAVPDVDFSQFGEIEEVPLSKIAKLTAANLHRSWLNVPAVTQFDDADVTDMEAFRQSLKGEAEKRGVKLTPAAFLMVACAKLLKDQPVFNRSWHSSGEKVIQKHFINIGMAVDTPRGLVVPVIRNVDQKSLFEVAADVSELAEKARTGKLAAADMQGGGFSISSLGAIGGRGFTPIVNTPEAAILGVSKTSVQPVWDGEKFVPRTLLPLSLTYDHRLINGADAGRFLTGLVSVLGDIRRLLL